MPKHLPKHLKEVPFTKTAPEDRLMTANMAAEYLGISNIAVNMLIYRGMLKVAHREGRNIWFTKSSVHKYHQKRKRFADLKRACIVAVEHGRIDTIEDIDWAMIQAYSREDITLEDIGETAGLTRQRISQRLHRALWRFPEVVWRQIDNRRTYNPALRKPRIRPGERELAEAAETERELAEMDVEYRRAVAAGEIEDYSGLT